MHGSGDVVARQPLFVGGLTHDGGAVGQHERDAALDADELAQPLAQLGVRPELEEERRGELALVGDELVVRGDLVGDLLVAQHALAPSP